VRTISLRLAEGGVPVGRCDVNALGITMGGGSGISSLKTVYDLGIIKEGVGRFLPL